MTIPCLLLRGPLDWVARMRDLAEGQADEIVEIEAALPFDILDKPVLLLFAGDPTVPESRMLKLLSTVQGFDIHQGSPDELEQWARENWAPEPEPAPVSETGALDIPAEDAPPQETAPRSLNAFLIAPAGDHDDLVMAMAGRGINCDIGCVPLERARVEAAEHIFVWVPATDEAPVYEKIVALLTGGLDKPVTRLTAVTWQEDLTAALPEIPASSEDVTSPIEEAPVLSEVLADPGDAVVSHDELIASIDTYIDLLKEMVPFNDRREPYVGEGDMEDPVAGMLGTINRWLKTAMSYRKGLADFTPWKERKCPDAADATVWETIQTSIREQAEHVQQLLAERQILMAKLVACEEVRSQVTTWAGVEETARDFLARRYFGKLLRERIDAERPPHLEEEGEEESSGEDTGLLGFFKKGGKPKKDKAVLEAEEAERAVQEKAWRAWRSVAADEFDNIAKDLVERFWSFYQDVALDWIANPRPEFNRDEKRRFLRCGLLGLQHAGLSGEQLEVLRPVLKENDRDFTFEDGQVRAVYFDEYLEMFAEQEVAPSYDEELELNSRGTPEWKAARELRKVANQKRQHQVFLVQNAKCRETVENLKEKLREYDEAMKAVDPKDKASLKTAKEKHHQAKVRLGRVQEFIEKTARGAKAIPKPRPTKFPPKFPLEFWVRKEIKHLRSKTRLINKLKDQNFPEALSEEVRSPAAARPIAPSAVAEDVAKTLQNDPALFDHEIVPHKKRDNALIACVPPLFIITPGGGQEAVCLEPSGETGEGRVMLPTFIRGSSSLHDILVDALSDYRWDTCMLTAGNEWVTSDTLVGAYSRCRWEYRNKDKDVREKALFYKEETDKKNFRRHYKLFEKSAEEGGKMLFFKSRIAYENLIKYFVLPPGVEKLERG